MVCCSLFSLRCSLFVACCLLFVICCSLVVAHWRFFFVRRLLFVVLCSSFVFSLCVVSCSLFVVRRSSLFDLFVRLLVVCC